MLGRSGKCVSWSLVLLFLPLDGKPLGVDETGLTNRKLRHRVSQRRNWRLSEQGDLLTGRPWHRPRQIQHCRSVRTDQAGVVQAKRHTQLLCESDRCLPDEGDNYLMFHTKREQWLLVPVYLLGILVNDYGSYVRRNGSHIIVTTKSDLQTEDFQEYWLIICFKVAKVQ